MDRPAGIARHRLGRERRAERPMEQRHPVRTADVSGRKFFRHIQRSRNLPLFLLAALAYRHGGERPGDCRQRPAHRLHSQPRQRRNLLPARERHFSSERIRSRRVRHAGAIPSQRNSRRRCRSAPFHHHDQRSRAGQLHVLRGRHRQRGRDGKRFDINQRRRRATGDHRWTTVANGERRRRRGLCRAGEWIRSTELSMVLRADVDCRRQRTLAAAAECQRRRFRRLHCAGFKWVRFRFRVRDADRDQSAGRDTPGHHAASPIADRERRKQRDVCGCGDWFIAVELAMVSQ